MNIEFQQNLTIAQRIYQSVSSDIQKEIISNWLVYTKLSKDNFYKRLQKPKIEDLAILEYLLGIKIFESKMIVNEYKFAEKNIFPITVNLTIQ